VLQSMHPLHPEFEWNNNKGYGTATHVRAIREHGVRPGMHRMSFAPCRRGCCDL
jgi:ribonuclease HII